MGESNDSFFEKALLKNINEDIPINVDLSDTPEKVSVFIMRTLKSELKKEILLELKHKLPVEKKKKNTLKSLSKASPIKFLLLKAK